VSREYKYDITACHRLIVGEGESDRNFLAELCVANSIGGFDYAFAGIHNRRYNPSGFDCFGTYLIVLQRLAGFPALTDLVLVCDSTDNPSQRLTQLRRQIRNANRAINRQVYDAQPVANTIATSGNPRLHVLMIPHGTMGGLESVCVDVLRDTLNNTGQRGTEKEVWVNTFANSACVGWTTEKGDKLRLQAFISAAWPSKPDMHFSQLFDITANQLIPLDGGAFQHIKQFLEAVAAL
jgi:hypothetical protein